MDSKLKYMLLKTVQDKCILPVTSVCNMICQFCSHYNNPPGLDVYSLGHLKLDLIEELLDFLPEDGPVIIGESATRIIEGDPLTHPGFKDIITRIRNRYPLKQIKITTNGSNLVLDMIEFLENNSPVELNISLNCSGPDERVFLMSDKNPERVFTALEILAGSSIRFNGSIVAMPHLTGWKELERTIRVLAGYDPETIRVFMPGFTRFSEDKLKFHIKKLYNKLKKMVDGFYYLDLPVLLEPPMLNNFKCIVKGVIKGSAAFNAGLKKGDIIKTVNNNEVLTRADGFNKILFATNPVIKFSRGNETSELIVEKESKQSSGIIVDYDMELGLLERLSTILLAENVDKTAIITSYLGQGVLKAFLDYFYNRYHLVFKGRKIDIIIAKNNYFAGSIMSAGLLTNEDIIRDIKKTGKNYKLIILPGIIFDIFGNDLTGKSYKQIEEELSAEVVIV